MVILPRWLQPQSQSQRMILLVMLLLGILLAWLFTWVTYYQNHSQTLGGQIEPLHQELLYVQRQYDNIQAIHNSPDWAQQQVQLKQQVQQIRQQLQQAMARIVLPYRMLEVLRDMLAQNPQLQLEELKNVNNVAVVDPKHILPVPLYQHNFIIEFKGNYIATLDYLVLLEQLPWQLYWDSINYQVDKYPEAKITIRFHSLSPQERLVNG